MNCRQKAQYIADSTLGLDRICWQNFEQNRQAKEISNAANKMGHKKKKRERGREGERGREE